MLVSTIASSPSGLSSPAVQTPLLEVRGLRKVFPVGGAWSWFRPRPQIHAVDGIDFTIHPGEIFSLVGESGCGKSTTGRLVLRLLEPTAGEISFLGRDLLRAKGRELKALRRQMQIIFQDPFASLNPRMTIGEAVEEPLKVHGVGNRKERRERVRSLLERVGLGPEVLDRYPHEFSGGQRQRVCVARAIALHPRFIVADEPVSSLDVSIQAQVINLLLDLQEEFHIAYLFIAHDLNLVRQISDRVAVMYLGKIVEMASTRELFHTPLHPYTHALLAAIPVPDPRARGRRILLLEGEVPSPIHLPPGCRFHPRCPRATPECRQEEPPLEEHAPGHRVACFHAGPPTNGCAVPNPGFSQQQGGVTHGR